MQVSYEIPEKINEFFLLHFRQFSLLSVRSCMQQVYTSFYEDEESLDISLEMRKANGFGSVIYLKDGVRKVPQRQYSQAIG